MILRLSSLKFFSFHLEFKFSFLEWPVKAVCVLWGFLDQCPFIQWSLWQIYHQAKTVASSVAPLSCL